MYQEAGANLSAKISAEVALYALGEVELAPIIDEFLGELEAHGLQIDRGPMSTLVIGDCGQLFEALRAAFAAVSEQHRVVLRMVISNACPIADPSPDG